MLTGMHAGNYSMWLNLGGRGFDTAWEYGTQAEIAAAVIASGVDRSEIFITSKIPGSLYGGCCGCPGAKAPGEWPPCKPSCHDVCFPTSGHYTAQNVGFMNRYAWVATETAAGMLTTVDVATGKRLKAIATFPALSCNGMS
eukprot:gene1487-34512_t